MKDNRHDDVVNNTQNEEVDEFFGQTDEEMETSDTKRQIIKYAAAWVAIVALFFAVNAGIRSITAAKDQAAYQYQNGYSGGQPVANGYSTQPAVQGGTYDAAGAAGVGGGCGSGGCGSSGAGSAGATSTGGGGCCGGSGGGQAVAGAATADFKQLEKEAINLYVKNYGDANVTAEVKDFGCHQQINILKDGKVVKEFSYQNGQLQPLTPW